MTRWESGIQGPGNGVMPRDRKSKGRVHDVSTRAGPKGVDDVAGNMRAKIQSMVLAT